MRLRVRVLSAHFPAHSVLINFSPPFLDSAWERDPLFSQLRLTYTAIKQKRGARKNPVGNFFNCSNPQAPSEQNIPSTPSQGISVRNAIQLFSAK
jgi:hypothetical protein